MTTPGTFRLATPQDRPHFMRLFQGYLTAERKGGSHTWDSLWNLNLYRRLFDSYTTGSLFGWTILWTPPTPPGGEEPWPAGVVMGGEGSEPTSWETDRGKVAILWGVFVEEPYRGKGVGLSLQQEILQRGLQHDYFQTIETSTRLNNPHGEQLAAGFGTTAYATLHFAPLRKESP